MTDKLTSEILSIKLDSATFNGTKEEIMPTYVNFFFGNNGTGKSTIAKTIQSGTGVTFPPGRGIKDYNILVYNQEFIDKNVSSYHDLPGVFTINDKNVKIQEQIDEKESLQESAKKKILNAKAECDKLVTRKDQLLKQLYKDCWSKTSEIRESFDKTQEGKKRSKALTEEIRLHEPVEQDLDKILLTYNAAFSEQAKRYELFNTIADTRILEDLPDSDVLGIVIANSAQTGFASFLEEIGATEWVREGHTKYHEKAEGKCPYCSRKLQEGFEKIFTDSFDDSYEKNIERLNHFLDSYRNKANGLYIPLTTLPKEIYPAVNIKTYNDKLAVVKATIASNIDKIREKIKDPTKLVTLENTEVELQELSNMIAGINKMISTNNDVVDAGPAKQKECQDQVFSHMAFMLKDVFQAYDRSESVVNKDIKIQNDTIRDQNIIIKDLDKELSILHSQTVETETAIRNINAMLKDASFQGFEVRPRKDNKSSHTPVINYEVVRSETGDVAKDLSEGEKNFIAFLYFQQRVFGKDSADNDSRDKIVVIDDPVSSMDSNALFIIAGQIRKMIEICRNNTDNRDAMVKDNFIKQLFVLTHNAYFHREITYVYADRYEFVSFYKVEKKNNKSSVILKRKRNPECPTEWLNVNPVKNSYAALWEEYKEATPETTSISVLLNVIRRIVEYYFLQICGYDGNLLRETILEENGQEYKNQVTGEDGYTKFDIAKSMLMYISSSSYGINDGFYFTDDSLDFQQCKDTFELIFKHMKQEQHYRKMMGIK